MLLFSSSTARVETLQITQKYVQHLRETVHPFQGHRTLPHSTNWRILTATAYCNWLLLSVYRQGPTRALLNNENRYDTNPFFFLFNSAHLTESNLMWRFLYGSLTTLLSEHRTTILWLLQT